MTENSKTDYKKYGRWGAIALAALLVCFIVYLNKTIFVTLAISYIIAYILNPLIEKCEAHKISRFWSIWMLAGVALIILVLLFFIIVPQIQMQTLDFKDKVSAWAADMEESFRDWMDQNQGFNENIKPILKELHRSLVNNKSYEEATFADYAASIWSIIRNYTDEIFASFQLAFSNTYQSVSGFIVSILNLLMFPVFTFYFLHDYQRINKGFYALIPPHWEAVVQEWMSEVDGVLGRFIRGQFTIACILAIIYGIGLSVFQVPMGAVIGLIAGMANMVPYIGIMVGLAPALLFSLIDNASLFTLFGITFVFVGAQLFEGFYLAPRIMSDEVGLHPIAIMVAIIVGGTLFGFPGLLLAVPVAAIVKVIFLRFHSQWKTTW